MPTQKSKPVSKPAHQDKDERTSRSKSKMADKAKSSQEKVQHKNKSIHSPSAASEADVSIQENDLNFLLDDRVPQLYNCVS